jgi:hypothetical protein
LLKLGSDGSRHQFENLSTLEIPNKVYHIESIAKGSGPKIIYSSNGEIGILSFSVTSEQLIPLTRISVEGMKESASLLTYFTKENLLVIMAAGKERYTIYQTVYDPVKGSLSRGPEIDSSEHLHFHNYPLPKPLAILKQDDSSVTVVALKNKGGGHRLTNLVFKYPNP